MGFLTGVILLVPFNQRLDGSTEAMRLDFLYQVTSASPKWVQKSARKRGICFTDDETGHSGEIWQYQTTWPGISKVSWG